jgi:hypothetical protein
MTGEDKAGTADAKGKAARRILPPPLFVSLFRRAVRVRGEAVLDNSSACLDRGTVRGTPIVEATRRGCWRCHMHNTDQRA